jgi:membrane protease YdiL (CAAX protease family)
MIHSLFPIHFASLAGNLTILLADARLAHILDMITFLKTTWRDIRALPSSFIHDRAALAITGLILLPWLLLWIHQGDVNALQPLTWISAFIAFYWLIGHQRPLQPAEVRRPRLELLLGLALAAIWIVYRIGEYWHWYTIPTFGLNNSCGPIAETPLPKMIEMFLMPVVLLIILKYSLSHMGFNWDKFSWLAALVPLVALIVLGLTRHTPEALGISSACFFFGAGLPEEFLYRAFIQTRLEAVLRHPLWAVWLASFVFGLSHVPIDLAGSFSHWQDALLTAFTYQMTVGFAMGYAYMRTRNVLPLSFIHTLIDSAF